MKKLRQALHPDWRKAAVFSLILFVDIVLLINIATATIVTVAFGDFSNTMLRESITYHLFNEHGLQAGQLPWFQNITDAYTTAIGQLRPAPLVPPQYMWITAGFLHTVVTTVYFPLAPPELIAQKPNPAIIFLELAVSLVYIYLLSCLAVGAFDYFRKTRKKEGGN